jgi:hypothetical protein
VRTAQHIVTLQAPALPFRVQSDEQTIHLLHSGGDLHICVPDGCHMPVRVAAAAFSGRKFRQIGDASGEPDSGMTIEMGVKSTRLEKNAEGS